MGERVVGIPAVIGGEVERGEYREAVHLVAISSRMYERRAST
jgi:hypothetical protein